MIKCEECDHYLTDGQCTNKQCSLYRVQIPEEESLMEKVTKGMTGIKNE